MPEKDAPSDAGPAQKPCEHARQMQFLVARSQTSARRCADLASLQSKAQLEDELKLRCQAACRDNSPYREADPAAAPVLLIADRIPSILAAATTTRLPFRKLFHRFLRG